MHLTARILSTAVAFVIMPLIVEAQSDFTYRFCGLDFVAHVSCTLTQTRPPQIMMVTNAFLVLRLMRHTRREIKLREWFPAVDCAAVRSAVS